MAHQQDIVRPRQREGSAEVAQGEGWGFPCRSFFFIQGFERTVSLESVWMELRDKRLESVRD